MSGNHYSIPSFGYVFIQSAMLVVRYGLKYDMPGWVTWFPSIIVGGVLGIVLFVLLIWLIVVLIGAMINK